MNVIVMIEGREAIPVRAIPLLTDWNFMSPDVVAEVLAGNGGSSVFIFDEPLKSQMRSYRIVNGNVVEVKARWWKSWSARELRALSTRIGTCEPIHEIGYQKWRDESLFALPTAVFVWKEEFERLHAYNWRIKSNALNCQIADEEDSKEITQPDPELAVFVREQQRRLDEWRDLDFSPLMKSSVQSVVMEGFELQERLQVQTLPLGNPLHQATLTTGCDDADRLIRMQAMLNRPEELDAAALQDAIEKNAAEIKYWEDAPITSVADAAVKQDKLKPLYSERENLAQQHRVMRGDYTEAYPGPKTTVLSTETVAAFGSSNSVAADKAGLLVRAPAQSPATPAPVAKTKAKRRTWRDVSNAYIIEVMQAGQYATAKELYHALEAKAGPDSPFDKGTGANRGSLFVREIAQPLSLKTVQNELPKLRELSQK